jgi:GTP pyrophosphokinase
MPTRTKRKPPPLRFNLPVELKEKLGFLLSKAEDSKAFFARIGKIYPPMDKRYKLIKDAYDTARKAFRDKKREGGGRYFEHLRAVTLILLVFMRERNAKVIAAALLHDIVEDIDGWSIERVEREFGKKVAKYVWWVTKPSISEEYPTKLDVDRKYHLNLRYAPRNAIAIKLADRLHNCITMWGQDRERMQRKVAETRDFILPIAEEHMLTGIHALQSVLKLIEKRYKF